MSAEIHFPQWPVEVVRRIAAERGARVWPVGGSVRDALMGRARHDWDFAVEGDALGLARTVADTLGGAFYPLDEERDTGRVILWREERRIELDFARLRGPDLESDLRGRDFTVNAIAVGPGGELIDPTGGLADLQARLVRAIGPEAFDQDPLRMLRAVRLAAELGFRLEEQTSRWIAQRARELLRSSPERVRDEFVRILNAPSVAYYLQILDELGLMDFIIPEVDALREQQQTSPHRFNVWWHTLMTVEAAENILHILGVLRGEMETLYVDAPTWAWDDVREMLEPFAALLTDHLRQPVAFRRYRRTLSILAALLHDIGKPLTCTEEVKPGEEKIVLHFYGHENVGARLAADRMRALRFSRAETDAVARMIRAHLRPSFLADAPGGVTGRAAYRFFKATGESGVEVVLLALADHLSIWGPNLQPDRWERRLEAARRLLTYYSERVGQKGQPRLVTGEDLMQELGLSPGPQIGRLLEAIQEAQAEGTIRTREEALDLARRMVQGR
ncbi:MAG: HD domain-containing protein [Anaerolineae bacterium]|nr:HD domain-containing protein [Anaerolineae bacterium]MCX8066832.1 HD domain-containing protein [Anaerolineae bacterium]MDW7992208.1 HD domain-containing protein [Anaerolineae bacterium]